MGDLAWGELGNGQDMLGTAVLNNVHKTYEAWGLFINNQMSVRETGFSLMEQMSIPLSKDLGNWSIQ